MKTNTTQSTERRLPSIVHRFLILVLILLPAVRTNVWGQNVKVNLDVKEMKVSDVFKMIKQQTQMSIVYNDTDLNPDRKITLKVSDADLKSVLTRILEGTNLTYTLEKNYIILFLKSDPEENENLDAYIAFSKVHRNFATHPIPIMKAAEALFLRAEGTLYGWDMGGTARIMDRHPSHRLSASNPGRI